MLNSDTVRRYFSDGNIPSNRTKEDEAEQDDFS